MPKRSRERLKGLPVRGRDGDEIGKVVAVFADVDTDERTWMSIKVGPWLRDVRAVPLSTAQVHDDHIRIPYTREKVEDSPFHDPDRDIGEEKEHELSSFYGLIR